jgi:hypothetical protein
VHQRVQSSLFVFRQDQRNLGALKYVRSEVDGYRELAIKDGARVQPVSHNQKDLTRDYPRSSRPFAG